MEETSLIYWRRWEGVFLKVRLRRYSLKLLEDLLTCIKRKWFTVTVSSTIYWFISLTATVAKKFLGVKLTWILKNLSLKLLILVMLDIWIMTKLQIVGLVHRFSWLLRFCLARNMVIREMCGLLELCIFSWLQGIIYLEMKSVLWTNLKIKL